MGSSCESSAPESTNETVERAVKSVERTVNKIVNDNEWSEEATIGVCLLLFVLLMFCLCAFTNKPRRRKRPRIHPLQGVQIHRPPVHIPMPQRVDPRDRSPLAMAQ